MSSITEIDRRDAGAATALRLDGPGAPPFACGRQGSVAARSLAKRALDVAVALLALLFLAPLFLVVAFAIALESEGPILFKQRRTGLDGRPFKVLKFRTMRVMEDGGVVQQARRDDARITRVGYFLRRSSIDELPQLLNVLRGDMSLVGPRPHALAHDEHFAALAPGYAERFRARPGITGLAQVRGLRGEIRTTDQIVARTAADNEYIARWSLGMDLWILLKTAVVAPLQRNAY